MFKSLVAALACLVVLSPVYRPAGAQDTYNKVELLFLQGYHTLGARTWGMGGTSVASVRDVTALRSNPARLSRLEKMECYGEAGYRRGIQWLSSYTADSYIRPASPAFVGLSIGVKDRLSFGLAYYTHYGLWLDMGEGVVAVGGSHTCERVSIYSKASIRRLSFAAACRLNRHVSFGCTYEFNRARSIDHYGDYYQQGTDEYTYSGDGHSLLFGLDTRLAEGLHLGATVRPQYSIRGSQRFQGEAPKVRFKDDFPAELRIGCSYRVNPGFTLAFDCQLTLWDYIQDSAGEKPYTNTFDIFTGVEVGIHEHISLLIGHCTRADPWKDDLRIIHENQDMLTAGGSVAIGRLQFNFSIMDSHLLQSEDIETSKMLLGFTYQLRKGGASL